jgi:endonuclease YncB( thermonuclease family)
MKVLWQTIVSLIPTILIASVIGLGGATVFHFIESAVYDYKEDKARTRADITAVASVHFSTPPQGAKCVVLKVIDGNSVILRYDNKSYAARLGGVNCPTGSSRLGKSAKKTLVYYLTDVSAEDWIVTIAYNGYARRDTKNYLVCDMFVKPDPKAVSRTGPEGFCINRGLVRSGRSRAIIDDVFYPDVANSLRADEQAAIQDRCGIWENVE